MSNGILDGFKDLEGIDEAKKVLAIPTATLEKLIEIEKGVVKNWSTITLGESDNKGIPLMYLKIYESLSKKFADIYFSEEDLISFIYSKLNVDYTSSEAKVLGMYSGCLLEILMMRNKERGVQTKMYLNGNGNKFDYLFNYCRFVDELIVDNFTGDHICYGIARNGGEVKRIVGINIKGKGALSSIAQRGGRASQIIGINIQGEYALNWLACHNGNIGQIVAINVSGENALWTICFKNSVVQQMVCVDCDIKSAVEHKEGRRSKWPIGYYESKVYQLIVMGLPQLNLCETYTQQLITERHTFQHTINQKFSVAKPSENAEQIRFLSRSLKGKTYEEVISIAEQIYSLRPIREQELVKNYMRR